MAKGISYSNDEDFNNEGHMALSTALGKDMKRDEILTVVRIQSYDFEIMV